MQRKWCIVTERRSNSVLPHVLAVFVHPSLRQGRSGELRECHVQAEVLEGESGLATLHMLF